MKQITQYDLLLSCPGDIPDEEHLIIEDAVSDFNKKTGSMLGLRVEIRHWLKDSYAESGGKPQDLLNKQFVEECDLAIALFWMRFGKKTDKYGSGTEEEIEIMCNSGKQVFVGFSNKSAPPSEMVLYKDDYQKILAFREKYKDKGIYFMYSSVDELRNTVSENLRLYFTEQADKIKADKTISPKLSVCAISHDGIQDNIAICTFRDTINLKITKKEVCDLFSKIQSYNICEYYPPAGYDSPFFLPNYFTSQIPVVFQDEKRDLIKYCAKKLGIELTDNFFSLGSLMEEPYSTPTGYQPMKGSADEQNKYNDLNKLYKAVGYFFAVDSFREEYDELQHIRLAVSNNGTTFDEDIEITLCFPQNMLIKHNNLPNLTDFSSANFILHHSATEVFGIPKTLWYSNYDFTANNHDVKSPKTLHDMLNNVFIYDYFDEGDFSFLRFQINYLKHGSVIAFPSIIFVNHGDFDIKYALKSKHFMSEIKGTIGKINA
jgi:hypothetical protein